MLHIIKINLSTSLIDKSIIHQDLWDAQLIMNLLKGISTRSFSLALGLLVSMLQAIYFCKACVYLPLYLIVVIASWSCYSTTKKPSLLYLASCASCFIIFLKALSQTNNKEALSKPVASRAISMTSHHCNLNWRLIYRDL